MSEAEITAISADISASPARAAARRGRLLWALAWLGTAALAFGHFWPQDTADSSIARIVIDWAAFMVRTFDFHLGLAAGAFAIVAFAVRCRRAAVALTALAVAGVAPSLPDFVPRSPAPLAGTPTRVMSVNLLRHNQNTAAIVAEILRNDPDLLLLQEYTEHWHAAMSQAIAPRYPYASHVARKDSFGLAIYSRLPVVEPVRHDLPIGDFKLPQARGVFRIGDRDVAVYNIHLMPPSSLMYKTEQRRGFAALAERLTAERLPTLMAGDFNFTLSSHYADRLRSIGLRDAHELAGWGRAATWPAHGALRYLPGVRIDHFFLSPELTATQSQVVPAEGSDHRAITAAVGVKAER